MLGIDGLGQKSFDAGGGEHIRDLEMLRCSIGVFGKGASNAVMSRFFQQVASAADVVDCGFAPWHVS